MSRPDDQRPTLHQVIGRQLRAFRSVFGLRQEDIAAVARMKGLDWVQATIAAIEAGQRPVSIEELLILPSVLRLAAPGTDRIELLPGDELVALTPQSAVPMAELRRAFAYILGQGLIETLFFGEYALASPDREKLRRTWFWLLAGKELPPLEYVKTLQAAAGEAERKAAAKLGVSPVVIAAAAYALWGRSLSEERDRRVAALGEAPARTVQARRGHVTRTLLAELTDKYPARILRWLDQRSERQIEHPAGLPEDFSPEDFPPEEA
jgi:hypothetical protein